MLPSATQIDIRYDTLDTLNLMKDFNDTMGFNKVFEELGATKVDVINMEKSKEPKESKEKSHKNNISKYNQVSKDEVVIAWEHYKTNYLDVDQSSKNDDSDDIEDLDDDDEDDGDNIISMLPNFIKLNSDKPMHYTPWGKFDADNTLSPINLYDLRVMHFKGFTTRSIENFPKLINSIEGISIWGQIDPYFVVLAIAKMYDYETIKKNVEDAIYKALNIEIKDDNLPLHQYVLDAVAQSKALFEDGIENFVIVFPEPNLATEVLKDIDEKKIGAVNKLMHQIENLIVFKNGEFYEC